MITIDGLEIMTVKELKSLLKEVEIVVYTQIEKVRSICDHKWETYRDYGGTSSSCQVCDKYEDG